MAILGAIFKGNRITISDADDAKWFIITNVIDSFTFEVRGELDMEAQIVDVCQIVKIDKSGPAHKEY